MNPRELESALRDCLTRRATLTPPPGDGLADYAVRRARALRRRRAGVGAFAIALFAVLGSAIFVRLAPAHDPAEATFVAQDPPLIDPPPVVPSASAAPPPESEPATLSGSVEQVPMAHPRLPVDVVVDDHLLTPTGQEVDLSAVGAVAAAYRVAGGWLVVGHRGKGGSSLWQVSERADPHPILTAVDEVVLDPGGNRVAWRQGAAVYVGVLTGRRVEQTQFIEADDDVLPAAFAGDAVLLVRRSAAVPEASAEAAKETWYGVWWPGRRGNVAWREAIGVYGVLPDERTVVAQLPPVRGAQPCLALLDVDGGLGIRQRACDLPLVVGAVGWLSPDGRWLVAEGAVDAAVLIDVSRTFGDREPAKVAGPGPYGPGAWIDRRTVVHGARGHLVRLRLDLVADGRPGAVERIPVRTDSDEPVLAVPKLVG